jgi:hypothetical protein
VHRNRTSPSKQQATSSPSLIARLRSPKTAAPLGRGMRMAVLTASVIVVGVVAAPFALGSSQSNTLRGGTRNPASGFNFSAETQIIASNSSFGTRQSNKGTGGGAIYGCRSLTTGPACISAVNLNSGNAFSFTSRGNVGGVILLSNKAGAPLTTNATGVATGFNANFLQGKQASEFIPTTKEASFAQTNQLLFAAVSQTGVLGATRGATSAAQTGAQAYTVTFNVNVSKCSFTASPTGAALTTGSLGVALDTTNPNVVDVSAPSALTQGFNVQVIC